MARKACPTLSLLLLSLLHGLIGCARPGPFPTATLSKRENLQIHLELVSEGFTSPVLLVTPANDRDRLFVVDQIGFIWVITRSQRQVEPFLDLRDRLVDLSPFYDERGLLGLAFHPRFAENGRFFVYYSAPLQPGLSTDEWDHTTHISEFHLLATNPLQADPASERVILSIDKPGYNYEAGNIAFGSDGYLYIALGDSARRPDREIGGYAQNLDSLLGKILRIDVDGEKPYSIPPDNPFIGRGSPEIYAYGLRNPYRFSFDAGNQYGLIVADVGHAIMEEINVITAGGNYGWPIREGTTCFNPSEWTQPRESCGDQDRGGEKMIDPVLSYPHTDNLSAVIGGHVYRGQDILKLKGAYIFGDWGRGKGRLFAAWPSKPGSTNWPYQEIEVKASDVDGDLGQILGFGEDGRFELYVLVKAPRAGPEGESGRLYRMMP